MALLCISSLRMCFIKMVEHFMFGPAGKKLQALLNGLLVVVTGVSGRFLREPPYTSRKFQHTVWLLLPTLLPLECEVEKEALPSPYKNNVLSEAAWYCSVIFIHKITRLHGLSSEVWFANFLSILRCVHYSTNHFKLYYGSCSFPYTRRLELDLNPLTPMFEVTRWHQTYICKNAFALHRQLMFAFWWLASDHGRKSLTVHMQHALHYVL